MTVRLRFPPLIRLIARNTVVILSSSFCRSDMGGMQTTLSSKCGTSLSQFWGHCHCFRTSGEHLTDTVHTRIVSGACEVQVWRKYEAYLQFTCLQQGAGLKWWRGPHTLYRLTQSNSLWEEVICMPHLSKLVIKSLLCPWAQAMINCKTEEGNSLMPAMVPLKWQLLKCMEGLQQLLQIPSILWSFLLVHLYSSS